jgi:hypothetical protein
VSVVLLTVTLTLFPPDVIPTGLAVAYDLYILRNYSKLQDEVVARLRPIQFEEFAACQA